MKTSNYVCFSITTSGDDLNSKMTRLHKFVEDLSIPSQITVRSKDSIYDQIMKS